MSTSRPFAEFELELELACSAGRFVVWLEEFLRQEAAEWPPHDVHRWSAPALTIADEEHLALTSRAWCAHVNLSGSVYADWSPPEIVVEIALTAGEGSLRVALVERRPGRLRGLSERLATQAREAFRMHTAARGPGRPGLPRDEVVYRVACALWAEELRKADPQLTWGEVCQHLPWKPRGTKSLSQWSMDRLAHLRKSDPEGILVEAQQRLAELRIESKKIR